jgi:hypothetical protein
MNNNTATAIVRRHLEAVTRMLLGSQTMKPGLAIIAADRLSGAGTADLAHMAKLSETDVICLEFDLAADEPDLLGITIVAPPRPRRLYLHWLPADPARRLGSCKAAAARRGARLL